LAARASQLGIQLLGFSSLLKLGEKQPPQLAKVDPEDTAFIMYTSGTTGRPKGVELTHKNICCSVGSFGRYIMEKLDMKEVQSHMSFLPLAHSFEQSIQLVLLSQGGKIGFGSGSPKMIGDDWKTLQPTLICGVPRVYEKTIEKIEKGVELSWTSWLGFARLYNRCKTNGLRRLRFGSGSPSWYESGIWSKLRAKAGWSNVKLLVSGAAPLPIEMAQYLQLLCGRPVTEGYGMTETFALGTHTVEEDPCKGQIGIPFDNVEIRLKSCPEQRWLVSDTLKVDGKTVSAPRGEIQFRGPTVFKGYYKNAAKTAETLKDKSDNEFRWLSSGDVGRINPNGTLSIIGRTKDLFKTRSGEYIAPRMVEGKYDRSPAVNQIWIYGNSYKNAVMAVVVPNAIWAVGVLQKAGIWQSSDWTEKLTPKNCATPEFSKVFSKIAGTPEAKEAIKKPLLASMRKFEKGLNPRLECAKDIIVETEIDELMQGFNVGNKLLTPTFKKRCKNLLEKYKGQLKELYAAHGEAPADNENW